MCFIIALAIYDGGIDLAVPALLIGLFLGNASFSHQVMQTQTIL